MARQRRRQPADLTPYVGCSCDEVLGLDPLAVGWLTHQQPFPTGAVPRDFAERLLVFCHPAHTVCCINKAQPCPLCRQVVPPVLYRGQAIPLGTAEVRLIGEEAIYAAPTLIYHYVTVHHYRPPDVFINAVLHGPQPPSAEFRALIRALQ